MTDEESLEIAKEIAKGFGLEAELMPGAFSVGVGGDCRTYTGVINLRGPWHGHEKLAEISTQITNRTSINRVIFEIVKKTDDNPNPSKSKRKGKRAKSRRSSR